MSTLKASICALLGIVALLCVVVATFGDLYIENHSSFFLSKLVFYSTKARVCPLGKCVELHYKDIDCSKVEWISEGTQCKQLKAAGFGYLAGLCLVGLHLLLVSITVIFRKVKIAKVLCTLAVIVYLLSLILWCALFPYQSKYFSIDYVGYGFILAAIGFIVTIILTIALFVGKHITYERE
eukprot:TRINITY_DN7029_c0_g1_i1.p1 TRINITY_DN7029_c0_g1~~TRINITY_DN7029_c0_g1_i1.p1  ORF type:complete len:181 (-),score=8.00 TRINITY_DN7029_c0_g1_i1:94-636(-)